MSWPEKGATLTPSLSHPMGEGDHSDALDDLTAHDYDERVGSFPLSRPTGEGRGEGSGFSTAGQNQMSQEQFRGAAEEKDEPRENAEHDLC